MRHFILFGIFVVGTMMTVQAQIEFGIKAGVSPYDLAEKGIFTTNGTQNIDWHIADAGYGHHFGIYTRLSALGLFLEQIKALKQIKQILPFVNSPNEIEIITSSS